MKKIIAISALLLPVLLRAQQQGFEIKGAFSQLKSGTILLSIKMNDQWITDSTEITDGHFQFTGKVKEPTLMNIRRRVPLPDHDEKTLFLGNDLVLLTGTDDVTTSQVTGSTLQREYEDYHAQTYAPFRKRIDALQKEEISQEERRLQMDSARKVLNLAYKNYARQHPASYCSVMALDLLIYNAVDSDLVTIQQLYAGLSAPVKHSTEGKKIAESMNSRLVVATGAMAPLFTQNDVNGQAVHLADFRGKYVLIDFWASWCKPCRAENPTVVAAWEKFKDKNFTVLGISLDKLTDKDKWLAAIKSDGLQWTQVSDLNFWNNAVAKLYAVQSIPKNFLIDPQGRIIAKNLRGEALEQKLAELLH